MELSPTVVIDPLPLPTVIARIREAKAALREEYLEASHARPWIVAYSGGKDSTLMLQLVVETLLKMAPSERKRHIHVIANDTLVESPPYATHLNSSLERIREGVTALGLPMTVVRTTPKADQTFWVNLIGRGYPSPNRMFRWCTDRMKIQPTSEYIRSTVDAAGEVVLLIGVRRSESSTRAATVDRHTVAGSRLNPHSDLRGCWVMRPIVDFSTDEVWQILLQRQPPWGGTHRNLITLYKNAQGGECPLVIDKASAPSCGTSSSRFGCWTCTVVEKDKSLTALVDAGLEHLEPLLEFRDWLVEIRAVAGKRERLRRSGNVRFKKDGEPIPGPYTMETRQEILDRLLSAQTQVGEILITENEIALCKKTWREERNQNAERTLAALSSLRGAIK